MNTIQAMACQADIASRYNAHEVIHNQLLIFFEPNYFETDGIPSIQTSPGS